MELRHLRYFIGLAGTLNFTRAAEQLHVTQSTLSHQIKQLETEIGLPLFDRIGKRVALTEAGDEFLLMGLRLREGIEPARYRVISGRPLDHPRIAELMGDGLIATSRGSRLAVTPAGFPVLDAVVADLAA